MVDFWQAEGNFNWKLASKCKSKTEKTEYRSTTIGSLFEATNDRPFVRYEPKASLLSHFFGSTHQQQVTCQPSSISALRSIPGTNLWFMTVVEPLSATRSSLRRTLYTTDPTSKPNISQNLIDDVNNDFKADLQTLIKNQIDITTSANSSGSDQTMTASQIHLLEQIETHLKQERKAGIQIFPAAQPVPDQDGNSSASGVAERCKNPHIICFCNPQTPPTSIPPPSYPLALPFHPTC